MKILIAILLVSNICSAQNTILWEVRDTSNKKLSYVVGTYHHIGNSFVDSIPFIQSALINADIAIFESVDDENQVLEIFKNRKEDNQIESMVSKEDYASLKKIFNDSEFNLSQLKPIELLIALRREFQISVCKSVLPTDKYDHFDNYLISIAKEKGKIVMGLESDSLQLEILENLQNSWDLTEIRDEISYWISKINLATSTDEHCDLVNRYMKMDLDYEFNSECEDDILNSRRNEEWITKLSGLLSQKNCFIAVGLLHLKYRCGLLEAFRKNGFIVNPIILDKASH